MSAVGVQKRLDELKRPPYLHRLELVSLDIGTSVPLVRSVRAVAGAGNAAPDGSLWPQLVLDLAYSGCMSLTIQTKLELQKAPLFNTLQSTFEKLKRGSEDKQQVPDGTCTVRYMCCRAYLFCYSLLMIL